MNKVILGGRLTRDPQMETKGGHDRVRFTLAVMRDYKNKATGEYEADFPYLVAWRHRAQYLVNYCRKGDYIEVSGSVKTVPYADESGQRREYRYIEVKELRRIAHPAGGTMPEPPAAEPEPEAVFNFTDFTNEMEELEEEV